jgi:hypothetical protein
MSATPLPRIYRDNDAADMALIRHIPAGRSEDPPQSGGRQNHWALWAIGGLTARVLPVTLLAMGGPRVPLPVTHTLVRRLSWRARNATSCDAHSGSPLVMAGPECHFL